MEDVGEPFLPKHSFNEHFTDSRKNSFGDDSNVNSFDVESSASDTSSGYYVDYKLQTLYIETNNWRQSHFLKAQIFMGFISFTLLGMAEQAVGALIPIFQKSYQVSDLQTSMIFLSATSGYILMGFLNGYGNYHFGLRGVFMLGILLMGLCYFIFSFAPPFWVLVAFSIFNGIGCGLLDAALNSWVGDLVDSNQILGILHGCYGLGCMITPSLISNLMGRKENPWKWNDYYTLMFTITISTAAMSLFLFKNETSAKYRYLFDLKLGKISRDGIELANLDYDSESEDKVEPATMSDALKSKLVWVFAVVLFFYVGGETAFGSWLISFLLRINNLEYKLSSHIATSFWLGLMLGRVVLGFVTAKYFETELMANLVYIAGSVAGYIVFYLVSFTSWHWLFFVIVFITGVFVGPIFPTTILSALGVLPPKYHATGIGFICAFAGGGAAAVPFMVGLVADASITGLRLYPLIILGIFVVLLVVWCGITKKFLLTYKRSGSH